MNEYYLYNRDRDIIHGITFNEIMEAFKTKNLLESETSLTWYIGIDDTNTNKYKYLQ